MTKIKYILILFLSLQVGFGFAQKKSKRNKEEKKSDTPVLSEASIITSERLFFDGQAAKFIGNIDEAYDFFNRAAKLNPHIDAAFYELAQLQQLAGDYVSAQKSLQKALDISPKNIWYQQYNGDLFASQYKYEEAAGVYAKLKKENPKVYEYYFQQAYYLILAGKLKESIVVYDEIENAIGIQTDASLQKHKIYSRLNKPDEAIKELEKLINTYPDEIQFKNSLAEFYLINEDSEKAVKIYEEILIIEPNNVIALTSLADYYKTIGDNEKAFVYSKKAFANPEIPIDAKISVLYNYIKFFDQRKEQITEAFKLADILIETHPTEAKAYAIAGDLKNLNNEAKEALNYYYKSLEQRKDIFTVWQQIFFINSDLSDFEALKTYTEQAKEYFPNQALVYFFNGLAFQQTKDYNSAEKAYNRGVKMAGENKELSIQLYSNLGDTYNDLKRYTESDENFDKALELNERNAYVLNNYSYYLSLRGEKLDKAAEMSKLSNDISPRNSSFLDTYAWVMYKSGKYKEAKEWQLKAIEASANPSATLIEHLGDILFKLGEKANALEKWQEALELKGGSPFLDKKIAEKQLYE
jgi:tetratricopeptide (TPR) repeat protein